jgi:hypothetical protein
MKRTCVSRTCSMHVNHDMNKKIYSKKLGSVRLGAHGRLMLVLIGKNLVWKNSLRKRKVILNAAMNSS